MKFLYHHRTSASDGSAVHIDGLVDALRALGHEVVVSGPTIAKREPGQVGTSVGRRLRNLLPQWLYELAEIAYNVPECFRLRAAIAKHAPDVVYERYNLFLFSGVIAARQARVPIILEVNSPLFAERSAHGGISFATFGRRGERWVWRSVDAVVAVTRVLADTVSGAGRGDKLTAVMHNGVDVALFNEARVIADAKARLGLEGTKVIGFTGFVREWNGLQQVVDLLPSLPSNTVLLVVGDGPACDALRKRAVTAGVVDRVKFCGLVARHQIPDYVSAFDVALLPAANAYASPLKLFEYLALGRAVVAPDQPNIREILEHGRNSWLFEPDRPASMQQSIARLIADDPLRQRLAQCALQTVREGQMTWQRNAERVVGLAVALNPVSDGYMAARKTPLRPDGPR